MASPSVDRPVAHAAPFAVTDQQRRFFQTFGFLRLPGVFAHRIADITAAFEDVVAAEQAKDGGPTAATSATEYAQAFEGRSSLESFDHVHFGRRRLILPFVLDRHPTLSSIVDDQIFTSAARSLVGPDYEVVGSDGNVFDCDTSWHIDSYGAPIEQLFVKFFLYLDPVTADSGALRVIPGSHHVAGEFARSLFRSLHDWRSIDEAIGVDGEEVPSWVVESAPGDLLVSYYRTMHATYGGSTGRRLIAINLHGPDGDDDA